MTPKDPDSLKDKFSTDTKFPEAVTGFKASIESFIGSGSQVGATIASALSAQASSIGATMGGAFAAQVQGIQINLNTSQLTGGKTGAQSPQ